MELLLCKHTNWSALCFVTCPGTSLNWARNCPSASAYQNLPSSAPSCESACSLLAWASHGARNEFAAVETEIGAADVECHRRKCCLSAELRKQMSWQVPAGPRARHQRPKNPFLKCWHRQPENPRGIWESFSGGGRECLA